MKDNEKCDLCNGKLILKETKVMGGATYRILKCEKCNHQVARSE